MKNVVIIVVVIILAAGTIFNGYLYTQESQKLIKAQSQIAALSQNNVTSPDVTGLNSDIAGLKSDMASLKTSVGNLQTSTSSTGDVAGLKGDVATLKSDVANLKVSVSNIQSNPTPSPTAVNNMLNVVKQIEPAVVRIDVTGAGFTAAGSGFIIDSAGYVVTNQHVIDSTNSINLTLMNGDQFSASVVSSDSKRDIALLKMNSNRTDFPTVTLGTANDIVIGQVVIAAGFPLGPDLPGPASFTRGIVSAIRTISGLRYLQTDVNINPGSSGGCLVEQQGGKVVGITSAAVLPRGLDVEGIGLAIPVDDVQTFVNANLKK